MQNKPWRDEEWRKCEEALQGLKEGDVDKASRLYKAKTGTDFHPKAPSDVTKETRGEIVEILDKVEQNGKWPQRACTTMFFLIPNVRSEMPIAHMPTLIRWWKAQRAPEVVKWQQTYRVEWDVTDDRNQGRYCGCFVGISSTRGECSSKVVRQSHCKLTKAILPGSKWSCLSLRIVRMR